MSINLPLPQRPIRPPATELVFGQDIEARDVTQHQRLAKTWTTPGVRRQLAPEALRRSVSFAEETDADKAGEEKMPGRRD